MKEKIIYYFYNLGLKGWENYLVLLACVMTSIIVVYNGEIDYECSDYEYEIGNMLVDKIREIADYT